MTGQAGGGLAGRVGRLVTGRPRLFAGCACGLLVWVLIRGHLAPITGTLLAWDTGVLVYLVLAALLFVTEPIDGLPVRAEREEEGEWTIFALTVAAAVVSLAAILGVFADTKGLSPAGRNLHIGLVAVTLLISWLMMHTTFAFRYAHEFYAADLDPPQFDRGLEFPGEPRPDYLDFMYFSLVLGMTFQVSDVQITARKLRRLAALHGLLSFLFNTIILALTVNIAAGLV
ncbi:MAG TPA: DUF1345 domain-containing protein [Acetobacteraceae bacterium]|nr:DUF1345 domain-containing protein [Acetobacteraceae bacterium]